MLPSCCLGGLVADEFTTVFAFVVSDDGLPRSIISAWVVLKALNVFVIFLIKLTRSFFSFRVFFNNSSYSDAFSPSFVYPS